MNGNWNFFEGFEKILRERGGMSGGWMAEAKGGSNGKGMDGESAGAIWEKEFEVRIPSPRWGAFAP